MKEYFENTQVILASGILHYNDEVLVVRSSSMLDTLNDTEYYTVPSWEVPFGTDPQDTLRKEFEKLLNVEVETIEPVSTLSFMRDSDEGQHIVELVYGITVPQKECRTIEECFELQFIKESEVDSYIFSERIKQILKSSFQ